ncbi:MAG: class I SAM-dependent methyltransferase [Phycisphaerae bacterium]|nr:class I SAM-dependent methyltransferase [Phycisphaerae bacterium]
MEAVVASGATHGVGFDVAGPGLIHKLKNIIDRLRTVGLRCTIDYLIQRISWVLYDRMLGIQTTGVVRLAALGLSGEARSDYAPISFACLRRILRRVYIRPGQDVFIDYGSGMGRAVIVAATYQFKRAIGVELSPDLAHVAEANLARARPRLRCSDVQFVVEDATRFVVPDDVTVAFFFNPFRDDILAAVIQRIVDSLDRSPRQLTIAFVHPSEDTEALLRTHSRFTLRQEYDDWYSAGSRGKVLILNSRETAAPSD